MFVVCFERNDGKPVEEYYYQLEKDALYHFGLFQNGDSNLYKKISLFKIVEKADQKIEMLLESKCSIVY